MKPIFLIAIILFASCRSPQVITETVTRDSTIVREIPRIIEIPAAQVASPSVNIDSLVQMIQGGIKPEVINNTLTYTDPETNLRVGLLLDELGNLTAICDQQERQIEILEKEIERFRYEATREVIKEKPSFWQRITDSINLLFFVSLALIIVLLIFRR